MQLAPITENQKDLYNNIVTHPLQSYEWGEFREKTGVKVIRRGIFEGDTMVGGFQLTLHPIPRTPWTIGYLPKGTLPDTDYLHELEKVGKEENCIFIQLEPNIQKNSEFEIQNSNSGLRPSAHPLFTKYTLQLALTKSEEELLKNMHSKTRYNIRVAQRHGVEVVEDNSVKAFERYWELMNETTSRQKFYAHTKRYHELQWQTFPHKQTSNTLSSHLLTAAYQGKILTAWMLFIFGDTLYYPYGASSSEHRETMHSTLMMWEAIKFGKKHNVKRFDMWGSLGPDPDTSDPWYGFHRFKMGFGPELIEFVGSYDLILNPFAYQLYKAADKLRWFVLRHKR